MEHKKIIEYLRLAQQQVIDRGLCTKYGDICGHGNDWLDSWLDHMPDWGVFWDSDSIWIPDDEDKEYTNKSEMTNPAEWSYVWINDMEERHLKIFCIAYDVDYDELIGNKSIIFDDDDFVV